MRAIAAAAPRRGVDPDRFRALVERVPDATYARYPALSRAAVLKAVDEFLRDRR